MVIVAGRHHPLARKKSVTFGKLSRERWLLREPGSSSRAFFDNQLALYLDNPCVSLSLNASDAILSCVQTLNEQPVPGILRAGPPQQHLSLTNRWSYPVGVKR